MHASVYTSLLDVLSPRHCVGCHSRLLQRDSVLCPSCMEHLSLVCFPPPFVDNPMARLFWGLVPVERAAALFVYEPSTLSAALVHSFKYFGRGDVAEQLGRLLARRLSREGFFEGIDAIVPVPLTRSRRRQRGYNQSELIAQGISSVVGRPVYHRMLRRTSFQDSQTRQNIYARRENVAGAFCLNGNQQLLEDRHVLLVDDVVTTGSTLTACATALLAIPGIKISIVTLGYANN